MRADGKFLQAGGGRFYLKGVTYGTFAPDADGYQFPALSEVARDFAQMASLGVNTVRTYTAPRRELLDEAAQIGRRDEASCSLEVAVDAGVPILVRQLDHRLAAPGATATRATVKLAGSAGEPLSEAALEPQTLQAQAGARGDVEEAEGRRVAGGGGGGAGGGGGGYSGGGGGAGSFGTGGQGGGGGSYCTPFAININLNYFL